ncbi:Cerebellar degeneration-related protein 2 [Myotis brandtii]|uniref:Cerebellar degeneration-related protein 2 n=1 Tax=Myotis brandtii TaxID=109478 RepID=S7NPT1_MYOBR|nr:Cerebellar degeneration-related protein 2 [Myotis brandtii]
MLAGNVVEASEKKEDEPCREQPQETEDLTKQMELPPQLQEQRAKVHEHLVVPTRELDETNQQLVAGSTAAQQKFLSVMELIGSLKASVHRLQSHVEELESCGPAGRSQGKRGPKSAPGFPGGRELCDPRQHCVCGHEFAAKIASLPGPPSPYTEENKLLKKAARTLLAQLSLEQQRRGALEEQFGLVLKEKARALELEAEVAEMRRVLQSERLFVPGIEKLVPDSLWVPFRKPGRSLLDEMPLTVPEAQRRPLPEPLQRSSSCSEKVLSSLAGGDIGKSHEGTCIPQAKAAKQSGVSRLQELDTQNSALKARSEELLTECQQQKGDSLSHKAVPIARAPARAPAARAPPPAGASTSTSTSTPPPRYKALFKEIFSCIQKRKQINKQRGKYRPLPSP